VRLGCGPCPEEQAFLSKRKQVVAKALKQALQLEGDLREDEVWGLGRTGWGCFVAVQSWPTPAWSCLLHACPALLPLT
jgi:hypothetical protein